MRLDIAVLFFSLLTSAAASAIDLPRHVERVDLSTGSDENELFKRRGGGGGGGRGGGSSGSKSGSKSSSSKSSKSSNSNSNSRTSSTSNSGGSSSKGSGPQPNYAGGRYYPGGSGTPYKAGTKSPSGIVPALFVGSAIAFWPGVWLHGAYIYHYNTPYRYYNTTSQNNETREVICGCSHYGVCGCDENNSTTYYDELIGNGSYQHLNKTVVNVAKVNGSETILINGTLPNGTTVQSDDSAAGDSIRSLVEALGFWPAFAVVMATVFLA